MADRQVRVRFLADTAMYRQKVAQAGKTTENMGHQIGQTSKRFGEMRTKMLGMAAGVLAAGRLIGKFAQDASALEQAVGATEAVFGDAGGAIDAFAEDSVDAVGLSERAFRELAAVAGAQFKNLGFSVDEAADSAIQMVEIGADLAAAFGGTTKDAVDALGAAFRGEADPAERFGLRLNIMAVNAKAVELGLAKSTSAVDANAKAQALWALIMEQTADTAGQNAREMDTLAGRTQRASAALEEASASIGESMIPVLAELAEATAFVAEEATEAGDLQNAIWAEGVRMVENLGRTILGLPQAVDALGKSLGDYSGETDRAAEASRQAAEDLEIQAEAIAGVRDAYRAAVDPLFAMLDADRKLADAQAKLTELQDTGEASSRDLAEAHQDVAEAAGGVEQAAIDLAVAVDNGSVSVSSGRATLQRWVTQGLITQAQADRMAAAFDNAGARASALGAHDIVVSARADMSSFDAALDRMQQRADAGILVAVRPGQIARRAHGGPFHARQPMLVGERGPEVVAFNQGGTVIPNHRLVGAPSFAPSSTMAAAGAQTQTFSPSVSVTVNRQADAPEIVREAMWQLKTMPR